MRQFVVAALFVFVSDAVQPRLKGGRRPHHSHHSESPDAAPDTEHATALEPLRPHIIYALIDDLGYAGLGFNSPEGEPKTPIMDGLVGEGVWLKQHYTFRFCGPSRSSFLSGRFPIHVTQNNCDLCGIPTGMTTIADVLQKSGYATHHSGKWHAGIGSTELLPINRGFNSSLALLGGAADHYNTERPGGPDGNYTMRDLWLDDAPAKQTDEYSTFRFMKHAMQKLDDHDPQIPLFLFMSFQSVHYPMQVPDEYLAKYDEDIWLPRRNGLAQITLVDESIGQIVDKLKEKEMWENTLFVVSSDNGGPSEHESNYPLRGGKGSDFEGGVRVLAFAAGPVIPKGMRGTQREGLTHIADWYATFAHVARQTWVDDKAAEAGLPAVDSADLWPLISGQTPTLERDELPLSGGTTYEKWPSRTAAFIYKEWKLIRGAMPINLACWPGPSTPNASDSGEACETQCGQEGCLFNIKEDPTEHFDVKDEHPDVYNAIMERALASDKTQIASDIWLNTDIESVNVAQSRWGGVWGPWMSNDAVEQALMSSFYQSPTPKAQRGELWPDPTDHSQPCHNKDKKDTVKRFSLL